jgi:hypothetical protein
MGKTKKSTTEENFKKKHHMVRYYLNNLNISKKTSHGYSEIVVKHHIYTLHENKKYIT